MKSNLMRYRIAGFAGGLLLAAGQFWGPACVLQLAALLPVMVFCLKDRKPTWAAMAGLYMGLAYTIPQMIYLRMPVPVTIILLIWMTLLLTLLCVSITIFLPRHPIFGPLAVGGVWYILDWVNFTAIPIWGMAQSFGRSWTAYPFAIQFISIMSISGILFVISTLQGLAAWWITQWGKGKGQRANGKSVDNSFDFAQGWAEKTDSSAAPRNDQKRGQDACVPLCGIIFLLIIVISVDIFIWFQKPVATLKIAAAGWVFDDRSDEIDPHKPEGFEKLFAKPAQEAAAQGACIFTTGEMGFYIAGHEQDEWIERFAAVARRNDLWLVVGCFDISDNENRIFFMSPDGQIVHEYTKTYLTPYEPGKKGTGDLKTIEVDGVTIGAMICQDDNFSKLTRYYGKLKADIVLCPTADWWTIKDAHLQAVRARAIECGYGIVRGAACGISATISPRGKILAKRDHYKEGPGYVISDIPVMEAKTFFSQFGYWPGLMASGLCATGVVLYRRFVYSPDAGVSSTRAK
jgi:apolipoprotein N-acyltransferase